MRLPILEDLPDVSKRRVLVRCDFNVPIADGRITDDTRIRAALPTLQWLLDRGALVTACTHLGRPKGRPDPRFDVAPVRARLAELAPEVDLMENLRFDPGEESNDPTFVARLVEGQDLYVNDAFGTAHRSHASVVGPPTRLPSAAGRLLAREVEVLSAVLDAPRRPFVAVIGGAKISDKIGAVAALLQRVDTLLLGGGMCFTFLAAAGHPTGDSLVDTHWTSRCREFLDPARLVLPVDLIVARSTDLTQPHLSGADVPHGWQGLDIGPETAAAFAEKIRQAGTVLWNGPMGMFEDARFATGTRSVAAAVADTSGFSVVGGGDTVAAVDQFHLSDRVDHLSTGGGATLEFVEHGDLPGLKALRESFLAHSG
jgi:phosphoglycerate kinase